MLLPITAQARDVALLKRLADRPAFKDEVDTIQQRKRRPGTVGKANGGLMLSTGVAGIGASVALMPVLGPLPIGGLVVAAVGTALGVAGLTPRGQARPASLRRHVFHDAGVVGTRKESAQIVHQLKARKILTPGHERFVIPGWDPSTLGSITVSGQPLTEAQRRATKLIVKRAQAQQNALKGALPYTYDNLFKSLKKPWRIADVSRHYQTMVQTLYMLWRLDNVALAQEKKRKREA